MENMDGLNHEEREAAKIQMAKFERMRKIMDAGGDIEKAEVSPHSSDDDSDKPR